MAKKYENEKNFLIFEITPEEAKSILYVSAKPIVDVSGECICVCCNNIIKDKIYYNAALDNIMDINCLNKWLNWAEYYLNWEYMKYIKCVQNEHYEKEEYSYHNFNKTLLEKFKNYV